MNKEIFSKNAPKPLGPYSQAVLSQNLIFCSGQLGVNPKTNILETGIILQTHRALENLKEILLEENVSLENIVRCDIFLTDLKNFAEVNKIYEEFFIYKVKPARQTVEVSALPKNALIEISCIAIKSM